MRDQPNTRLTHRALTTLVAVTLLGGLSLAAPATAEAATCTVQGSSSADNLIGTSGPDVICGGDGEDFIDGGGGNDTIYGDGGYDKIVGGAGDDIIRGGDGDDQLEGDDGNDQIYGGLGLDQIDGGAGIDTLYGEDDNDTILGGLDADTVYGGLGVDGLSGNEGDDELYGDQDGDVIAGGDGADQILGGLGADNLSGNDGNDTLLGGDDNDVLDGGVGNDQLSGELGTDQLDGGPGTDSVNGGSDSDTCVTEVTGGTSTSCETGVTLTAVDVAASYVTSLANETSSDPKVSAPAPDGSNYTSQVDTVTVTSPTNASGATVVTVDADDDVAATTISVGLPVTSTYAPAAVTRDGSVVYDDLANKADITVQAVSSGVRIATKLESAAAPTRYAYTLTIPTGATVAMQDSAVVINDSAGVFLGGFSPAWAKDANGVDVPTHYELSGNVVTQVVDTSNSAIVYPVVADPWLWRDLISSATWYRASQGWTLKVSPTGWARVFGGNYLVGVAGWNELYAKYRNRGLNTNLGGMKDQYICHQQAAALKPTWNLDEWRPNVSYAATVAALCNP